MPAFQNPFAGGFTRRHAVVSLAGLLVLIAVITFLKGIPAATSRYPLGWQDQDSSPTAELESLGDNLHLTQDQCEVLFPRLYHEADRAVEWTKRRGGITLDDLDKAESKGSARLLIWRNRVGVESSGSPLGADNGMFVVAVCSKMERRYQQPRSGESCSDTRHDHQLDRAVTRRRVSVESIQHARP